MHHAVGGQRRLPGERLVDALRPALGVHQQILRPADETQRRSRHRLTRLNILRLAGRLRPRWHGPRERRLVAPAARRIDAAQQHLQQVQRAAGVKAVGMGRDAAHGVHGDRPADHALVAPAEAVGPRLLDDDLLLEGRLGQFRGDPADSRGVDAAGGRHLLGRIGRVEITFREQAEDGYGTTAVRQVHRLLECRPRLRVVMTARRPALPVPDHRLAVFVAQEQAVVVSLRADHQPGGVGVAGHIVEIDPASAQQLVNQREHEEPVGSRGDPDPFVGDGRIAGAHRVDGKDLGAAFLHRRQAQLDRVGVMILGHAEQQEVARALPVRLAELPERAADRVEPGGGHVDRAEAAVGGVVRRAELLRPPAGQRLALVAPGEEGELARVVAADPRQPLGRRRQRLLPLDLLELARAARADALQGLCQPRRRVVLHDAGSALGAEHAAIDRVVRVAVDIDWLAAPEMDANAAAAGAHVTGRMLYLVGGRRRGVGRPAREQAAPSITHLHLPPPARCAGLFATSPLSPSPFLQEHS